MIDRNGFEGKPGGAAGIAGATGPSPNYWNEFIFLAYHHHQHDAIFLAGIPDVKRSLPHAGGGGASGRGPGGGAA